MDPQPNDSCPYKRKSQDLRQVQGPCEVEERNGAKGQVIDMAKGFQQHPAAWHMEEMLSSSEAEPTNPVGTLSLNSGPQAAKELVSLV